MKIMLRRYEAEQGIKDAQKRVASVFRTALLVPNKISLLFYFYLFLLSFSNPVCNINGSFVHLKQNQ